MGDKVLQLKTKDKILEAAIDLFNAEGYSNVSMQRLAADLSLSPGNLTYHYPKKEDLMMSLYRLFQQEMKSVIPSAQVNKSSLQDINQQISSFYSLQQRFLFFYLDLLDIQRSYPALAKEHYIHVAQQINTLHAALTYNVEMGFLVKKDESVYLQVAHQLWFTSVFWPSQIRVRGITDRVEQLRANLWQLICPYLSQKGHIQLRAFL